MALSRDVSPTYTLLQILYFFLAVAELYDPSLPWETKVALWLCPLYEFIEGHLDRVGYRSIFPHAGSSVLSSANAGYYGGILLHHLLFSCPELMSTTGIVDGLLLYPVFALHYWLFEPHLVGLHDGDGSWDVQHDGSHSPTYSIAINGPLDMPIKALLSTISSWTSIATDKVVRALNRETMCESEFALANHECCTIKRESFLHTMMLARPLRLIGTLVTCLVSPVRTVHSLLTSGSNWRHGVGFSFASYYLHLYGMHTNALPLLFFLYIAGLLSADGCIQLGEVTLGQSNQYLLEAIAAMIGMLPECTEPVVRNDDGNGTKSPNSRSAYVMDAGGGSMCAMMVVYFGSFDYMRRSQWLVLLLFILIKNANVPNEAKIVCLLRDLLKYIKLVCPS